MKKYGRFLCLLMLVSVTLTACNRTVEKVDGAKLQLITTLFPLYDFARVIGGSRVQVHLLLPPGVEPHGFDPRPEDIVRISKASLFVYTSPDMEPWAAKLLAGTVAGTVATVAAGAQSRYLQMTGSEAGHEHGHDHERRSGRDPHVWLDLGNAGLMVDAITDGLVRKDPASSAYYQGNAATLKGELQELDLKFRQGLAACRTKEFVSGGHYAFAYLANRYGLSYSSAYGISADTEPPAKTLIQLVEQLKSKQIHYLFSEELLSPRVSETIAKEAGVKLLPLHGLHNISRDELAQGVTFISLMEKNLLNLRTGLECQ